jgi:hypothetical protein
VNAHIHKCTVSTQVGYRTVHSDVARHRHDVGVIFIPTVTGEELRPGAKEGIQPMVHAMSSQTSGTNVPLSPTNFVVKIVYPPP